MHSNDTYLVLYILQIELHFIQVFIHQFVSNFIILTMLS
jgi:hypothetical protein